MLVSIFLKILAGLPAATWKGGTSCEADQYSKTFSTGSTNKPEYLCDNTPRSNSRSSPNGDTR